MGLGEIDDVRYIEKVIIGGVLVMMIASLVGSIELRRVEWL